MPTEAAKAPTLAARSSRIRSSTSAAAGTWSPGTAAAGTGARFRVDRLARPASSGVRFTPRRLPNDDAAAYVEQSLTGAPQRYEARVTLHAAAERFAGRVPPHWGTIEAKDAGSCEFRTGDDDLAWLALRIAMLGVDFEVHEPPELAEHLRTLAGRLSRAVADGATVEGLNPRRT